MRRTVILSFDVEQDCPPYLSSLRGIREGLPKLLDLLREKRVRATFFYTARLARPTARLVKRLIDEGHELGSHGYAHERLDRIPLDEAIQRVEKSIRILSGFGDVRSFRAPNLQMPGRLLAHLARMNIWIDSSIASYKPPFPRAPWIEEGIIRIPVSITSSVLRLPWGVQRRIHELLPHPRVYFSHPWEYVDMRGLGLRLDCVYNTGEKALRLLSTLIDYYRGEGFQFRTFREYYEELA